MDMSFFKVADWVAEFSEEQAVTLAKGHCLSDLPRFADLYRTICSDWSDFEYEDGDDISNVTGINRIKDDCLAFFGKHEMCRQKGHGEEFCFCYAKLSYDDLESEEYVMREAYKAVGQQAAEEARIHCQASERSPAFSRKYVESVVNGEREEDAISWAEEYERGVAECTGSDYSEEYIHQYAEACTRMFSEYAHAFAHCYERRIEAGDSPQEAWSYADTFSDILKRADTTDFGWVKAAARLESDRLAKSKEFDSEKYWNAFEGIFFENTGVSCDEELRQIAESTIGGKLELQEIEHAADDLYAKMIK
jgi:hypothetical protein